MNDKDKEAFDKWFDVLGDSFLERVIKLNRGTSYQSWLSVCEYKQKEIDELLKQLKHEHDLYKKHLKVYEDENAKLRGCVEFYSNPDNYFLTTHQRPRVRSSQRVLTDKDLGEVDTHIFPVGGKRARQVLKELDLN